MSKKDGFEVLSNSLDSFIEQCVCYVNLTFAMRYRKLNDKEQRFYDEFSKIFEKMESVNDIL